MSTSCKNNELNELEWDKAPLCQKAHPYLLFSIYAVKCRQVARIINQIN